MGARSTTYGRMSIARAVAILVGIIGVGLCLTWAIPRLSAQLISELDAEALVNFDRVSLAVEGRSVVAEDGVVAIEGTLVNQGQACWVRTRCVIDGADGQLPVDLSGFFAQGQWVRGEDGWLYCTEPFEPLSRWDYCGAIPEACMVVTNDDLSGTWTMYAQAIQRFGLEPDFSKGNPWGLDASTYESEGGWDVTSIRVTGGIDS